MFVVFDPLYVVRKAALLPKELVLAHATHVEFTASDRVFATDALLALGVSWTAQLQEAVLWARPARHHRMNGTLHRPGVGMMQALKPDPWAADTSATPT